MPYTPASTQSWVLIKIPTTAMKNNTLQLTLTAIVASSLALVAVSTLAVGVSYAAVAILIALAAADYRQGSRRNLAR
jgi:hypothetical protein